MTSEDVKWYVLLFVLCTLLLAAGMYGIEQQKRADACDDARAELMANESCAEFEPTCLESPDIQAMIVKAKRREARYCPKEE